MKKFNEAYKNAMDKANAIKDPKLRDYTSHNVFLLFLFANHAKYPAMLHLICLCIASVVYTILYAGNGEAIWSHFTWFNFGMFFACECNVFMNVRRQRKEAIPQFNKIADVVEKYNKQHA